MKCANESFDFLLGPYLLVAAVLYPSGSKKLGNGKRTVYLPTGVKWCEFETGVFYPVLFCVCFVDFIIRYGTKGGKKSGWMLL